MVGEGEHRQVDASLFVFAGGGFCVGRGRWFLSLECGSLAPAFTTNTSPPKLSLRRSAPRRIQQCWTLRRMYGCGRAMVTAAVGLPLIDLW